LVFADDLVLLGANLTKIEEIMVDLDKVLDDLGMKVNSGKTKWLAYLPNEIIPNLSLSHVTGFRYGQGYLENVDLFKYLGFMTSYDLSHRNHVQNRNTLMLLAARMMGKLLRSLEVTDFRSLRAYFYSLVGSQLYSMSVISFDEDVFERAQKVFLQEVFNLPPSFAKYMAKFLLGVEDFLLLSFDARVRFLQRISVGTSESSMSAMIMDREMLMPLDIGWNSGFVSLFPDHIEMIEFDLTDSGEAAVVRQRIFEFVRDRDRERLLGSAAFHLVEIFPNLSLPSPLATHLGTLPFESVRIFVIFLANMFQWTYLRSANRACPFCQVEFSSEHFFTCTGVMRDSLCDWGQFVRDLQNRCYHDALDRLFLVLQRWNVLTNHFTPGFGTRVDDYFEFTAFGSRRRDPDWFRASVSIVDC
jgi:hypothetical protein